MDVARSGQDVSSPAGTEEGGLHRGIGMGMLLFFVVGDILGAGIYARVGAVAGEVGGAIWVSFVVALIVSSLTALSYTELVTKYPGAAGAALYVNKAFKMPFFTFVVAFAVLASGISSASAVARAFSGRYLQEFIDLPALPVALVFLVVVALINFRGVSESVKVNLFLTLVEMSGLVLIMVIGAIVLASGNGDPARAFQFKEGANVPLAILGGSVIAFYAFLGFEDAVNMAEECKEPSRIFPLALLGGLALASLIYILVSFTAAMVVDTDTLATSSGALLEVVKAGPIPIPGQLFSAIALMAIANTALINMIMASRVVYGMANQGIIPRVLGKTHSTRKTPWVAIIFTTLIALVLAATGDLGALANTTVLLLLAIFAIVNVAVLVLRRQPVEHRHFSVPSFVPILGAITCLLLLTQQDADIWVRSVVLVLIGMALFVVNKLFQRQLDGPSAGTPLNHQDTQTPGR